jgi:hypothetical protein
VRVWYCGWRRGGAVIPFFLGDDGVGEHGNACAGEVVGFRDFCAGEYLFLQSLRSTARTSLASFRAISYAAIFSFGLYDATASAVLNSMESADHSR